MKKLLALLFVLSFVAAEAVQTQEYTKTLAGMDCVTAGKAFSVWRELAVYEVTEENGKKTHYSTITVHFKNNADTQLGQFLLKEEVPDSVAEKPSEVMNYSQPPLAVVEGSVAVEWMFDNVGPGQEKTVSYTVKRKVDASALKDYAPPKIISGKIVATVGSAAGAQRKASFDWTLPALVLLIVFIGGFLYYYAKRSRREGGGN